MTRKCDAVEFVKKDGTEVEPLEAVAAIVKTTSQGWEILGTGFFVTSFGTMFTAKHLVADLQSDAALFVAHKEFEGPGLVFRRALGIITHPTADVALIALEPIKSETTQKPVRCGILRVSIEMPPVNSRVGCWGFPQSHLLPPDPQFDGYALVLERESTEGVIEEHYPNGLDRIMHPGECFRTSMNTMGGASGGPVFNERGEVFAVVSTGFDEDTTFVAPARELALAKLFLVPGGEDVINLIEYVERY